MHGKKIISERCEITVNRRIKDTEGTYILRLKNSFIASSYKPGQFVMIKSDLENFNPLLGRPFSVFNKFNDYEFEVLYKVVGASTEILSRMREGDFLALTGPLGNGFNFNSGKTHVLIAGGIGIAPLYSISDYILDGKDDHNDKIILYYAAGKVEDLYFRHSIYSKFDETYFATDDGSFGLKGNVIELLNKNIADYTAGDVSFYACGPKPMLNALISKFSALGLSSDLQMSLEEGFGCGVGVCLGCAVKIKAEHADGFEYKRVCKDGPVFYADEIYGENIKKADAVKPARIDVSAHREADLSVRLGGLNLDYPVMPASGTFGYGEEFADIVDYTYFGALVSKGISLNPSMGNAMPRICESSCGLINSIGLQNVGFKSFRDDKLPFLKKFKKPVIVNFFGSDIKEYVELAKKLSELQGIDALEVNISCPNVKEGGRAFGSDPEIVYELVSSVREAVGDKMSLIVKLTPMVSDISLIAEVCEKAGADVISLINTIPAAKIDIETKKFSLGRGFGGLSGPAVKPIAIKLVSDVYNSVRIPVIGMGGISSWEDAVEFFLAGATAVSVGTYSFINPKIIPEIVEGLKNYLIRSGFDNIYGLIGLANR